MDILSPKAYSGQSLSDLPAKERLVIKTIRTIYRFYADGFRSMRVGRKLWLLIGIKLFVMFALVKVFFFPDFLEENFANDDERAEYILQTMTQGSSHD